MIGKTSRNTRTTGNVVERISDTLFQVGDTVILIDLKNQDPTPMQWETQPATFRIKEVWYDLDGLPRLCKDERIPHLREKHVRYVLDSGSHVRHSEILLNS